MRPSGPPSEWIKDGINVLNSKLFWNNEELHVELQLTLRSGNSGPIRTVPLTS